MKTLFILFIFIVTTAFSEDLPKIYSLEKIKGGYSKCEMFIVNYKFGVKDSNTRGSSGILHYRQNGTILEKIIQYQSGYYLIQKFNEKGLFIEGITYRNDSTVWSKYLNNYDKNGKLIYEILYDSNGVASSKYSYKYNDKGYLIEKYDYGSIIKNWCPKKTLYKYNLKNNLIEIQNFNCSDSLIKSAMFSSSIITYDESGNRKEIYKYNNDGNEVIDQNFSYDKSNNLIEEIQYSWDRTIVYIIKYKYNKNKNITEKVTLNGDSSLSEINVYNYDINERKIEEIKYNENNHLKERYTFSYDKFGNLIEETYYDELNEPIWTSEYIYSK